MNINSKQNIITVEVEDYYHVGTFHRNILRSNWYRFEKRIEQNTLKALELLAQFDIKATFFVLGWVADAVPEIVRKIAEQGHEVASKGYNHRTIYQLPVSEFREELQRGREALERASRRKIQGYRVAHRWLTPSELWVLDTLTDEGYKYDSSIGLLFRRFAQQPWRGVIHKHTYKDQSLWEFPLSSLNLGGIWLPISGGNYYRQFPHTLVKHAVDYWHRIYDAPFIMYFHIWELDPGQPRINTGSLVSNIRHYRNLNKMSWVLKEYFKKYEFTSIANYLELDLTLPEPISTLNEKQAAYRVDGRNSELRKRNFPKMIDKDEGKVTDLTDVTIVVPCYNEESNLNYLSNTLKSVQTLFDKRYKLHFIFVDDFSSDNTWETLKQLFAGKSNCTLIRHPINLGVAAAILTGIRRAHSEIVCSIDCDCTYDPHELEKMIPMLADDVDLVTASPYHSEGNVFNVPPWRLFLSKIASLLYKRVLGLNISTYTSCFRVYRRSAVLKLTLRKPGYLGIAEMAGLLYLKGAKVDEFPTTLEARLLGNSSMKIIKTIFGHFRLMGYLLSLRIFKSTANHCASQIEPSSADNPEALSPATSSVETLS